MSPRISPALARFVENLGLTTEAEGLPRAAGRLMAYLLLADEPVTFDDMVRDLGASRGGVSANTRFLESRGILERVPLQGERKTGYRLTADPFAHLVSARLARRRRTRDVIMEALSALPDRPSPARARLEEMKRFYDILIERLESVAADWRAGRHTRAQPKQ
jgi:DNA-binding transcriptional regulator GbsR (MarR family)